MLLNRFDSYIPIFSNKTLLFFIEIFTAFQPNSSSSFFICQKRMIERHSGDLCDFVKSQAERFCSVFFYIVPKFFVFAHLFPPVHLIFSSRNQIVLCTLIIFVNHCDFSAAFHFRAVAAGAYFFDERALSDRAKRSAERSFPSVQAAAVAVYHFRCDFNAVQF